MQFYLLFSSIAIYFYKKVHTNLFGNLFGRSPIDAIFIYYSILFIYTTEFNYLAYAILLFMEIYNIGLFRLYMMPFISCYCIYLKEFAFLFIYVFTQQISRLMIHYYLFNSL